MLTTKFANFSIEDDDIEEMDTADTPWYWFYFGEDEMWHRIEDDPASSLTSEDFEKWYLRDPKGYTEITTAESKIRVDFSGCVLINLKTGQRKCIKRSGKKEPSFRCDSEVWPLSLPVDWESMDPKQPFQAFPLEKWSEKYKEVERFVKNEGLLCFPIKSIYRIQNVDLWELYNRKKIQLQRLKGVSDIEERMLFHGTSKANVPTICKYNFDCRVSGRSSGYHAFGKGTYFAKHASLADVYSRSQTGLNSTKIMFLARVIVGKYRHGRPHYCKPDDGSNENLYDSCVDDELSPRIFVIFDCNQIYPEYLIEYGEC